MLCILIVLPHLPNIHTHTHTHTQTQTHHHCTEQASELNMALKHLQGRLAQALNESSTKTRELEIIKVGWERLGWKGVVRSQLEKGWERVGWKGVIRSHPSMLLEGWGWWGGGGEDW